MTRHDEVDMDDAANVINQPGMGRVAAPSKNSSDEKFDKLEDGKGVSIEVEVNLYDEHGKDKVLETPEDFATVLVSLEDDATLPVYTFRMWFSGVGLAVFGSVLGMLFVGFAALFQG